MYLLLMLFVAIVLVSIVGITTYRHSGKTATVESIATLGAMLLAIIVVLFLAGSIVMGLKVMLG